MLNIHGYTVGRYDPQCVYGGCRYEGVWVKGVCVGGWVGVSAWVCLSSCHTKIQHTWKVEKHHVGKQIEKTISL